MEENLIELEIIVQRLAVPKVSKYNYCTLLVGDNNDELLYYRRFQYVLCVVCILMSSRTISTTEIFCKVQVTKRSKEVTIYLLNEELGTVVY